MSLKKIIKEEVDSFQWIRDIQSSYPEHFKTRVEDFVKRFAFGWEGSTVTFEPIGEVYGSVMELGRVWMDTVVGNDQVNSWYWDLLQNTKTGVFKVEVFESIEMGSYEIIDSEEFRNFEDALEWIYLTMSEE
jgi:hypothetical protein